MGLQLANDSLGDQPAGPSASATSKAPALNRFDRPGLSVQSRQLHQLLLPHQTLLLMLLLVLLLFMPCPIGRGPQAALAPNPKEAGQPSHQLPRDPISPQTQGNGGRAALVPRGLLAVWHRKSGNAPVVRKQRRCWRPANSRSAAGVGQCGTMGRRAKMRTGPHTKPPANGCEFQKGDFHATLFPWPWWAGGRVLSWKKYTVVPFTNCVEYYRGGV